MWSLDAPLNLLFAVSLPFLIYFVHFGRRRGARLRFSLRVWQGEGFSPGIGFGKAAYVISRSLFWAGLMTVSYLPSTVFPTGPSLAGLPIGLQAVGAEYDDLITIDFTRLLAEEIGGFAPPPGY